MSPVESERRVRSGEVELAVVTAGDPTRPLVLLVHGYPDTKEVWTDVAARLEQRFFVVAYDVRGAGQSTAPARTAGYDVQRLADDVTAVLDAVAGGRRAHLVGHDWGSIQGWDFVSSPRTAARFASFTSISGPAFDHAGHWLRRRLARPSMGSLAAMLDQARRSWYIGAIAVPRVPEWLWRTVLWRRWPQVLREQEGVPESRATPSPTLAEDGAHGAGLYRRNLAHLLTPRPDVIARVPVQAIVPTGDHFVAPGLQDGVAEWAPVLRRRDVAAGHWVVRTHPEEVAGLIATFVDDVENGTLTMPGGPRAPATP